MKRSSKPTSPPPATKNVRLATVLGLVVYPQFQKPVDLPALRETLKQIATIADCEKLVAAVR